MRRLYNAKMLFLLVFNLMLKKGSVIDSTVKPKEKKSQIKLLKIKQPRLDIETM